MKKLILILSVVVLASCHSASTSVEVKADYTKATVSVKVDTTCKKCTIDTLKK